MATGHAALKHALQPHNRTVQLDTYDTVDDVVNRFDFIQSRKYALGLRVSEHRSDVPVCTVVTDKTLSTKLSINKTCYSSLIGKTLANVDQF